MDNDQTVFQNIESPKNQDVPAELVPAPVPTVSAEPPPAPFAPAPPVYKSDNENSSSIIKKLFKIVLGVLVILALVSIVVFVVLPNFSKNSGGVVTLKYWGLWEDSKAMQGIISDFERENPNIKIDYTKEDIKQYRERLITRINNGTGPDIFRFHNTWYPMLSKALLPLPSDTISKNDFSKNFYPVAQKDLIKNGAIYGIPLEIDTLALFINTKLLLSAGLTPPTTWSDFINDARIMTIKDEKGVIKTAGAALGTYGNITHAPDIVSLLFLQNVVDSNNLQASSTRGSDALSFYSSFATDTNNVWDNTLDPSILAFSKGNLAMYFGYSWDYYTIKQQSPNLSFEIVPVPQLPDRNIVMASYWAEGASVKSTHQKEAFLFLKYLSGKDVVEKLYSDEAKERAFGEPYARIDLADTLKQNKIIYPFVLQAKYASSSFFADSTFDNGLNQQSNAYLEDAVNSMLNGSSSQTAFDTLSKGVSQVLQKYGQ
jgi:multiple sugar transport system substrate-binding protein